MQGFPNICGKFSNTKCVFKNLVISVGRFVTWDVLTLGTLCPWDFFPWDILSLRLYVLGRFFPWDVLSWDVLSMHHYYLGGCVPGPDGEEVDEGHHHPRHQHAGGHQPSLQRGGNMTHQRPRK